MGRYKGKREASRSHGAESRKKETELFQPSAGTGDPFAEEEDGNSRSGGGLKAFWDSGKGKILLALTACVVLVGSAVGLAVSMWVKPPEMPVTSSLENNTQQPSQKVDKISTVPDPIQEEMPVSSDDELYPDDGYGGDMPTVSGNRKEGVYTFLLVGTDMDDGNTDTIMVVSYDTKNQDVAIMSIPRDTMINESWDIKKINSVYSRYSDGIGALKKRIKTLVGFTPDFYVKVDLSMFVQLVDLIGGVEFDVPQDMNYEDPYQNLYIHLKKGVQVLDGEKAMELVRFRRYNEGDIKRVEVQQNFMKALIKECLSLKHWGKIKAYIDLAMDNVQTDLEFGSVVWFAANVLGFNSGVSALNMDDVYTCTLPGDYWGSAWSRSTNQQQSYVTIYPSQVVKLVNERFNPFEQKVTTAMLDAMSIQSNGTIASSTGSLRDTTHNSVVASMRGGGSSSGSGSSSNSSGSSKQDNNKNDKNENTNSSSESKNPTGTSPSNSGSSNTPVQINPNGSSSSKPEQNSQGEQNKPSGTSSSNSGNNDEPNLPDTPSTDNSSQNNESSGGSAAAEPEPVLPSENNSTTPEPAPAPAPEPVPEPAPAPTPEPAPADTEVPGWLLS